MKYKENESGYIVYEDGGTCPLAYGASEEWYATYDEAIEVALHLVEQRMKEYKECINCYSVIVYEGSEELLHQSHSCPPKSGIVVFHWENYWRRSYN